MALCIIVKNLKEFAKVYELNSLFALLQTIIHKIYFYTIILGILVATKKREKSLITLEKKKVFAAYTIKNVYAAQTI